MNRFMRIVGVAVLALVTGAPGDDKKPSQEQPKVVRDSVKGSIHHGSGGSVDRIIGKVKVIDANTLEFADGTRVALDMVAPDLGQQGKIDGKLYPCGQEAAAFLRQRIGDRPVVVFDPKGNPRVYLGDEYLKHTMTIHGWALADHSSLHAAEIIARENKRGLWRGEFVDPAKWREGSGCRGNNEFTPNR